VKFLVDTNLPSRLCVWLRSHRHEAEHLVDLNLLTATDTQIWQRGRSENLVIFSKDVDFYDRALIFGTPPQVVHVEVGNCSNTRLFELLASEWDHIEQALLSGSRLISITLDIAPYPSRRRNSTHDRMLCLMEVCLVACLLVEESQQPTWPHDWHSRRATQNVPSTRHSSHALGVLCGGKSSGVSPSKCSHDFAILFLPICVSRNPKSEFGSRQPRHFEFTNKS